MFRKILVVAAAALPLLLFATPAATAATKGPHVVTHVLSQFRIDNLQKNNLHALSNSAYQSSNWSGYAVSRPNKSSGFRHISGYFTVPSVNCGGSTLGTAGDAEASQWVGIDGFDIASAFSQTVEQTGVDGFCTSSGSPTYYSWYEMYPLAPVELELSSTNEPYIQPGDAIYANIYYNSSRHQYQVVNDDITQGIDFETYVSCGASACSNATVEAISEVPGGGPPAYDLADYGMQNNDGITVTNLKGTRGDLVNKNWTSLDSITMVDSAGNHMSNPSGLYGGSAFSTTWVTGG